jgi:hypothetical protein
MLSGQPATATGETATEEDPAAYARRQLEQLGAAPVREEATEQLQTLAPQQLEMARKFQDTEEQARSLYRMFQSGQISGDQLQAQLKSLMILDENNGWWMMGVQTDTQYKTDATSSQWMPSRRRRWPLRQRRQAPPAAAHRSANFRWAKSGRCLSAERTHRAADSIRAGFWTGRAAQYREDLPVRECRCATLTRRWLARRLISHWCGARMRSGGHPTGSVPANGGRAARGRRRVH